MAIEIQRFEVKDQARGGAVRLATFNVCFGAVSNNGFELVKHNDKVFVSEPHRRYESPPNSGNWKRYSYVWFEGARGEEVKREILALALAEYERRTGNAAAEVAAGVEDDDDLPY